MQVLITHSADQCRITLTGRFTSSDDKAFMPVLEEIAAGRTRDFILDLKGLDFADSFALGLMLVARDEVAKMGASLRLTQPQPAVQRVFALTGLMDFLSVEGMPSPQSQAPKPRTPSPALKRPGGFGMGVTCRDGRLDVVLSGRFTFTEVEEFREVVATASAATHLVVDLAGLEFMDSAALSAFLIAHDEMTASGGRLVLANPPERIRKLFDLTAVGSILCVEQGDSSAG